LQIARRFHVSADEVFFCCAPRSCLSCSSAAQVRGEEVLVAGVV